MPALVEDEDEIAARFAGPGDEDVEDDDVADDDDETEGNASPEDRAAAYERRLKTTVSKRLAAYRQKLQKSVQERVDKREQTLNDYVTQKLDEWRMRNIGSANVSNPEAVGETLVRAAAAAEDRVKKIMAQLAELEKVGVDVGALREKMAAATAAKDAE